MEQLAANAERASIRYKQVEYMADKLGKVYQGVISGVTEWGFYVELNENKCEGLVPVRDLADDYYDLDEKNYCLIGRRHGNKYMLGDEVKVQVARADLDRKQLDFMLVEDNGNPNKPLPPRPSKNKNHGRNQPVKGPRRSRRPAPTAATNAANPERLKKSEQSRANPAHRIPADKKSRHGMCLLFLSLTNCDMSSRKTACKNQNKKLKHILRKNEKADITSALFLQLKQQ